MREIGACKIDNVKVSWDAVPEIEPKFN